MENIETLIECIKIRPVAYLKRDRKLFAEVQENQDKITEISKEREDYEALDKLNRILGNWSKSEERELNLANLNSEAEELSSNGLRAGTQ